MSGATSVTQGINPNVPVGAEATSENRANSVTSFDQVEDVMNADDAAGRKSRRKSEGDQDGRGKQGRKDKGDDGKVDDDGRDPDPKKHKAEGDEAETGKDGDTKPVKDAKDAKDDRAAKPKVHKVRSGDKVLDVTGDSVVKVPINGKHEDVSVQDLVNNYSGKIAYDRKFGELSTKEREFEGKRTQLNGFVDDLFKRSEQDPDAALDYIAELTGKDAVQLRSQLLRQQFEQMKPLFDMTDDEREVWFKDRERDARDKVHDRREKVRTEREATAAQTQKVNAAKERYGIDDAAFDKAEDLATRYLKAQPGYKDQKPSTEQIVWAQRMMLVSEVVHESVPHLAKHQRFGDILNDVVADAIKHPSLNREKLGKQLKETFGEDNETLRKVGRKAQAQAEFDGSRQAQRNPDSKNKQPLTFDDI